MSELENILSALREKFSELNEINDFIFDALGEAVENGEQRMLVKTESGARVFKIVYEGVVDD